MTKEILFIKPKKYFVRESDSILIAIKTINRQKIKVALVVNDDDKLTGVLTDGDIRRGLLKNSTLLLKCSDVMNKRPKYSKTDNEDVLRELIQKYNLPIPIIDQNKKVTNLCVMNYKKNIQRDNIIIIMAGGKGKRLLPLTATTPKPMLKIKNKPIIQRIIEGLKKSGFSNITISVNYKSDKLVDYFSDGTKFGVNISYLHEKKILGTVGGLSLMNTKNIYKPIIVLNGDIITNIDFSKLVDFHLESKNSITMCAANHNMTLPYGIIEMDSDKISNIKEKPHESYLVNAGIYVFNPDVIKNIPYNKKLDMPTLINNYIKKQDVAVYPLFEEWADIGTPQDYNRVKDL